MSTRPHLEHLEPQVLEVRRPADEVCAEEGHDWSIETVTRLDRAGDWPIAVHCARPCGHRGYGLVDVTA